VDIIEYRISEVSISRYVGRVYISNSARWANQKRQKMAAFQLLSPKDPVRRRCDVDNKEKIKVEFCSLSPLENARKGKEMAGSITWP
jgi:hypothetical protein